VSFMTPPAAVKVPGEEKAGGGGGGGGKRDRPDGQPLTSPYTKEKTTDTGGNPGRSDGGATPGRSAGGAAAAGATPDRTQRPQRSLDDSASAAATAWLDKNESTLKPVLDKHLTKATHEGETGWAAYKGEIMYIAVKVPPSYFKPEAPATAFKWPIPHELFPDFRSYTMSNDLCWACLNRNAHNGGTSAARYDMCAMLTGDPRFPT